MHHMPALILVFVYLKVGIFDTGIAANHAHIRNIKERTNWTSQDSLADGLGHGSFVAGVFVCVRLSLRAEAVARDGRFASWSCCACTHA